MPPPESLIVGAYFLVLALLCGYGAHRFHLVRLHRRLRDQAPGEAPAIAEEALPTVTVQLPVFNERYVIERLIDAACALDYPRDRLEIQVLDDSTDETRNIAAAAVRRWQARGIDIQYLHREDRSGFKAGALEAGLAQAKGELITVFDADFIPEPAFLRRSVPWFQDPEIGMVQTRWGHLNRENSLLTRVQAAMLDGHFVVEHGARNLSGAFFNFNGTAGTWRRTAIAEAGGWEHDTLTEDLDLSYRAQLKGWRFLYLPEVEAPAELPVDINGFMTQQQRWAKGAVQTAKKLLGRVLRSDLPWQAKLEAVFHLTGSCSYILMLLLSLLMPIAVLLRVEHGWHGVLLLDVPTLAAATGSVLTFYGYAERRVQRPASEWVPLLPAIMAIGIGLSLSNAIAVLEGLLGYETPFTRTPKHGIVGRNAGEWRQKTYRSLRGLTPVFELAIAAYFIAGIFAAASQGYYYSAPFLALFGWGFGYVGLSSLWGNLAPRLAAASRARVESQTAKATVPATRNT